VGRAAGAGGSARLTEGWTRRRWLAGAAACAVPARPVVAQSSAVPLPIPPALLDEGLEVEGESLAARLARRLSVAVSVNGQGPFRFTVDSGADRTVIGLDLARALALPDGPPVRLHSTTGTTAAATVRIDTLRIGASEIRDIVAPALPERFLGTQGLLGIDALADQRLLLDFDARRITVQDSRRAAPAPSADEIVVTARRRNGQLILTEVRAGTLPLFAVIDSGSEVTVGNRALRDRLFARHAPPPVPVELIGVTGTEVVADSLVLPELAVGRILLRGLPVAFFDAPPLALFGLADRPALLLGTDVLRSFARVGLDFRGRRVRFRLRQG
jgi:hypothetical protein